jgi:hypothetical protein
MRIGTWYALDGSEGEFRFGPEVVRAIRKCEEIRSIRDKLKNVMVLKALPLIRKIEDPPEWFLGAIKTIHAWKSPARWAALAQRWRRERFDGDVEAYDMLETWRYHDYHLWKWESSQRSRALARRREEVRKFAAVFAEKYETLVLEEFDMRPVVVKPPPEEPPMIEAASSNRQCVSPSDFRLALVNAFEHRGGKVVYVDATNTTRECAVCGEVEKFDAANNLRNTCPNGHNWDQDENAAKNILGRYEENGGGARKDGKVTEGDEKKETKWQRVARKRTAKVDRMRASHEATSEPAE